MSFKKIASVAFVCLCVFSGAKAGEHDSIPLSINNLYVGIEGAISGLKFKSGGYNTLGDFENTGDASDLAYSRGWSVGYRFNDTYSLEFSYHNYTTTNYVTNSFRPPNPTYFYHSTLKTELRMLSFYRNFAHFGPDGKMSVFAGLGLGQAKVKLYTNDTVVEGGDTDHHFAWQIESGVSYEFNQHVQMYGGVRYVDMGNVDIELSAISNPSLSAGNFTAKLHTSEIFMGMRFSF